MIWRKLENMSKMAELFPSFFQDKFNKSILEDNSLIVIDTNYLLSVLEFAPNLANKYMRALSMQKNRLYIPYIVALEFNFNKSEYKRSKTLTLDDLSNKVQDIEDDLVKKTEEISKVIYTKEESKISKKTKEYIQSLKDELTDKKISSVKEREQTVYTDLVKILDGHIGKKPDQETINKIQEAGDERYKQACPPGYNDDDKKGYRTYDGITYQQKFGDLLIWEDLIEVAKKRNVKNIIFVTNDGTSKAKNDLYYKIKNQIIGPHIALMEEVRLKTKAKLYLVKNDRFVGQTVGLDEDDKEQIEVQNHSNEEDNTTDYESKLIMHKIKEQISRIHFYEHKRRYLIKTSKDSELSEESVADIKAEVFSLNSTIMRLRRDIRYLEHKLRNIDENYDDEVEDMLNRRSYLRGSWMPKIEEEMEFNRLGTIETRNDDDDD